MESHVTPYDATKVTIYLTALHSIFDFTDTLCQRWGAQEFSYKMKDFISISVTRFYLTSLATIQFMCPLAKNRNDTTCDLKFLIKSCLFKT